MKYILFSACLLCFGSSFGQTTYAVENATQLQRGTVYMLSSVRFEIDRHVMKPGWEPGIEKLYRFMTDNPNARISIEGHVCCINEGEDAYDLDTEKPELSVNRAKAVYDLLVARGVNKERMSYKGLGRSKPIIANEKSSEDAALNMRVEVRIAY